jgi:hypothetical protein
MYSQSKESFMERFDKGEDFNSFWDKALADNGYTEEDIVEFEKFVASSIKSAPLDNPRSIESFDDNLPF